MLLLLLLRRFEHFIVVNLSSAKKRQMSLRVSLALSQCLGRLAPIARCHSPFNAIPPTTHRPPRPVEKCANGSPVDPVPHSMFAILPTSAALLCTNFAMPNGWGMGGICAARDALAKRERERAGEERKRTENAHWFFLTALILIFSSCRPPRSSGGASRSHLHPDLVAFYFLCIYLFNCYFSSGLHICNLIYDILVLYSSCAFMAFMLQNM